MADKPWPGVRVAIESIQGSGGRARRFLAIVRGHPHLQKAVREEVFLTISLLLSLLFIAVVGCGSRAALHARSAHCDGPVSAWRAASCRCASGDRESRGGTNWPGLRAISTSWPNASRPW